MNRSLLFIDTETTGFYLRGKPTNHPDQPHLVQLGAILCDDTPEMDIRGSVNLMVMPPDGVEEFSEQVVDVHGITAEMARDNGVHIDTALDVLVPLCVSADRVIGYNLDFDEGVINVAAVRRRHDNAQSLGAFEHWPGEAFCAMKVATDICRLPFPSGRKGFKFPKLEEAHDRLVGGPMEGAHSAYHDARATMNIYRALKGMGKT